MNSFIVFACCLASVTALNGGAYYDFYILDWEDYKIKYGKNYEDPDVDLRHMMEYVNKRVMIDHHNNGYLQGLHSYMKSVNKFTDYTPDDKRNWLGFKSSAIRRIPPESLVPLDYEFVVPSYLDWRRKGAVTPVKNQNGCRSSWAFATIGGLEGRNFFLTGKLQSLSEQQLIDCDFHNDGCEGGIMDGAFQYISEINGIDSEENYPYKGRVENCKSNNSVIEASGICYIDIPQTDDALIRAVATLGPIPVAINADALFAYKEGILVARRCDVEPESLNHAVLVVGYGKTSEGTLYWIIKNSWGTDWGDDGYFRMIRGNNACGIATHAVYPAL